MQYQWWLVASSCIGTVFAFDAGLDTIGPARWDSGEGLGGAGVHSLSLFAPSFLFLG